MRRGRSAFRGTASFHKFELCGEESIAGTRTLVVGFLATARPSLVREPTGVDLVSSGRIRVEPSNGSDLARAVMTVPANYLDRFHTSDCVVRPVASRNDKVSCELSADNS